MSQPNLNRVSRDRPHCDTCDLSMWLLSIRPTDRGQELRIYECARCGASQTVVVTAEIQRRAEHTAPEHESSLDIVKKATNLDVPRRRSPEEDVPRIQHDLPMPTDGEEFRAWAKAYFASSGTE